MEGFGMVLKIRSMPLSAIVHRPDRLHPLFSVARKCRQTFRGNWLDTLCMDRHVETFGPAL